MSKSVRYFFFIATLVADAQWVCQGHAALHIAIYGAPATETRRPGMGAYEFRATESQIVTWQPFCPTFILVMPDWSRDSPNIGGTYEEIFKRGETILEFFLVRKVAMTTHYYKQNLFTRDEY